MMNARVHDRGRDGGGLRGAETASNFRAGSDLPRCGKTTTREERRKISRAIGPAWDGNGVPVARRRRHALLRLPVALCLQLQRLLSPPTMVLWLLMLRGIGIELRAHMENPVWVGLRFDFLRLQCAPLADLLRGGPCNVVRGVPLGADGYFFEPHVRL